jgi:hypothetical protein
MRSIGPPRWPVLTRGDWPANMQDMPHSFLIFDFGPNEEAAQQARRRVEGWKQGFRLDKKLQLKFERKEPEAKAVEAAAGAPKPAKSTKAAPAGKGKAKSGAKSKASEEPAAKEQAEAGNGSDVRLIVRLDFSDHEKLSHQRWVDRIPSEEPFKGASPRVVRTGEPEFKATSDLFDSLD